MKIGSLFSGVGGLELGLEQSGLGEVVWQVEIDPFCRQVLEKHWPTVERFEDVREIGARELSRVDVLCGGFPCTDISSAGKGKGLAGERSGLWFEFARIIGELSPEWVVIENVASGARRWVDQVSSLLGQLGYETLPVPITAETVGAPHLRRRIFIIAHSKCEQLRKQQRRCLRKSWENTPLPAELSSSGFVADSEHTRRRPDNTSRNSAEGLKFVQPCNRTESSEESVRDGKGRITTDPSSDRQQSRLPSGHGKTLTTTKRASSSRTTTDPDSESEPTKPLHGQAPWVQEFTESGGWTWRAPVSPICGGNDVVPNRMDRLKALGNSVVPSCAEVIGHMIKELKPKRCGVHSCHYEAETFIEDFPVCSLHDARQTRGILELLELPCAGFSQGKPIVYRAGIALAEEHFSTKGETDGKAFDDPRMLDVPTEPNKAVHPDYDLTAL